MSDYTIKAHPTEYRGIMFRSRLEATWAAYFDLAGVAWEYEPFDLEGWTPDLLLRVNGIELLSEIKPALEAGSDMADYAKAAKFAKQHWILLLGRAPLWYTIGCLCDQPPGMGRGDIWLEVHEKLHPANAKSLWAAATNTTRWRAPR